MFWKQIEGSIDFRAIENNSKKFCRHSCNFAIDVSRCLDFCNIWRRQESGTNKYNCVHCASLHSCNASAQTNQGIRWFGNTFPHIVQYQITYSRYFSQKFAAPMFSQWNVNISMHSLQRYDGVNGKWYWKETIHLFDFSLLQLFQLNVL